jgi:hypothetical protein
LRSYSRVGGGERRQREEAGGGGEGEGEGELRDAAAVAEEEDAAAPAGTVASGGDAEAGGGDADGGGEGEDELRCTPLLLPPPRILPLAAESAGAERAGGPEEAPPPPLSILVASSCAVSAFKDAMGFRLAGGTYRALMAGAEADRAKNGAKPERRSERGAGSRRHTGNARLPLCSCPGSCAVGCLCVVLLRSVLFWRTAADDSGQHTGECDANREGQGMGEQDSCPSLLLRRCAVSPLSCQASRTAVHLLLDEANFKEAQHGSDMPHSQEGAGGERTQETRAASDDSVAC